MEHEYVLEMGQSENTLINGTRVRARDGQLAIEFTHCSVCRLENWKTGMTVLFTVKWTM